MVCSPRDVFQQFLLQFRHAIILLVVCGTASSLDAQETDFQDLLGGALKPQSSPKASFSAELVPASAKPGDEVTLFVVTKLPPHSYIYATTGDFEMRTKIATTNLVGLEPIGADFQPDRAPETKLDPVLQKQVSKFYGDVTWSKKFRVIASAEASLASVDLELEGQYCSEGPGGECRLIRPPAKLHAALRDQQTVNDAESPPASKPASKRVAIYESSNRPNRGKTSPVEFHFQLAPTNAPDSKTVKLLVTISLDEEWHTFSTTFTGEGGTATEFSLDKIVGLKTVGNGFVPNRLPEIKEIPELNLKQEVYHGKITWAQEFEILPGTKPGAYGVEGSVTYQTCKTSCLPPKSEPFVLGVTGEDVEPAATIAVIQEAVVVAPPPAHGAKIQDKGLVPFLLTAFIAALAALITPCVFPMVPITVSFFLKQSEKKGGRPIALALVFSLAIIAAFVVIGVGIAALFGATKPNELANNWILNLFLASIFFAFALNMMGLFEIQVPSWLLTFTSTGEQTGGYVGVIFMALTFVLTSFSCTFAFVGSLLAAAAQGEYYWPILGMVTFGATFALPFFVLAMAPGAMKALPKSGGWLNSVKVVMGFIELGVAVKYISVVDQQWNPVPWIFDFTNVMTLWAVLSASTGLYLLGQFRMSHDSPVQGLSPVRVMFAVAFLVLSGLFAIGVIQPDRESWVIDQLVAFAPPRLNNQELEPDAERTIANEPGQPVQHEFELDFDRAVAEASAKNDKPLFVDFTGVNCVNCRLMEKRMSKPNIRKKLDQFVLVQLYTDIVPMITDKVEKKRLLDRNVALQTGWFGDVTLPAYAVVTPDGKTILSSYLGLERNTGEFAKFLDEGLQKWQSIKH
jgi:thiol:disulfide interchange protein